MRERWVRKGRGVAKGDGEGHGTDGWKGRNKAMRRKNKGAEKEKDEDFKRC